MNRKYEPGRLVTSLDELTRQKLVFHRKHLINVGWFSSWQIRYALKEIEKGNIRYADRKPVIWHYGEAIIP